MWFYITWECLNNEYVFALGCVVKWGVSLFGLGKLSNTHVKGILWRGKLNWEFCSFSVYIGLRVKHWRSFRDVVYITWECLDVKFHLLGKKFKFILICYTTHWWNFIFCNTKVWVQCFLVLLKCVIDTYTKTVTI